MRELKFRAWDSNTNKMNFPMEFSQDGVVIPNEYLSHEQSDILFRVGRFGVTLMQYTGLKDKNKKEIYESDVVYIAGEGLRKKHKEIVIFKDGKFGTKNVFDSLFNCEVIGNIHENLELLET